MRHCFRVLVIFAFGLQALFVQAQGQDLGADPAGWWRPIGPFGIASCRIAFQPGVAGGVVVAELWGGGVFASRDNGHTWSGRNQGLVERGAFDLAASPVAPGLVVLATENGVAMSWSSGRGWYQRMRGAMVDQVELDAGDPSLVYLVARSYTIGSRHRVLRSRDAGNSWRDITPEMPDRWRIDLLVADPNASGWLYVGATDIFDAPEDRLWASYDAGASWHELPSQQSSSAVIRALAVDPTDSSTMYLSRAHEVLRSRDGGASWAQVASPSGGDENVVFELVVSPHDQDALLAVAEGRLYGTTDSESSWLRIQGPLGAPVRGVAFDPVIEGRVLLASESEGLWGSTDGGASWFTMDDLLPGTRVVSLWVDPGDPDHALATHEGFVRAGLRHTADGGRSWSDGPSFVSAVAGGRSDPMEVLAGASDLGANRVAVVHRSSDGGRSWLQSVVREAETRNTVTAVAVHPVEPMRMYAAVEDGELYRSYNGGFSWHLLTTGFPGRSLHLPAAPNGMIFSTTLHGVIRSLDGGFSWQTVLRFEGLPSYARPVMAVLADAERGVVAAAGTEVMLSRDGGDSWSRADGGAFDGASGMLAIGAVALDPVIHDRLYVAEGSRGSQGFAAGAEHTGIWMSDDGGATWSRFNAGLGHPNVTNLAVTDRGDLLAGTWGGGVYRLHRQPGARRPSGRAGE